MNDKPNLGKFTFGEMREAYSKFVRGEPLTEKESQLAAAKHFAVKMSMAPMDSEDTARETDVATFPYQIGKTYDVKADGLEGIVTLVGATDRELLFMLGDVEIIVGRHWIKTAFRLGQL